MTVRAPRAVCVWWFPVSYLAHAMEEYCCGDTFPVWISPVQAVVMNITDAQADYARGISEKLRSQDVRIETDLRNEKIGFKIREARLQKVPYMLVVGDREKEEGTVTVRDRSGDQKTMPIDDFIKIIKDAQPLF